MTRADPSGRRPPGDRRAIPADPRLDPDTTVWASTDAGFGRDLAAPITSGTAGGVTQSWCQIHLTITTVVHTDSLPRIIMGLGNALLSDPGVARPPGHARGGYRSSGSAWLQMTVFANQVADHVGGCGLSPKSSADHPP
jgi:hypothetical protein